MLTIPPVHPLLMALLTDRPIEPDVLATLPHQSWEMLVQDSIAQRVGALLFCWINRCSHQPLIPHDVRTLLTQQIMRQTAWSLLLTHELRRILDTCRMHNIACIPIRGPIFAAQLYGDGLMRHMDDLDILVHRTDLPAIKMIFGQLGYITHGHRPDFLETYSYSLEFIHPQHGLVAEPHWTLTYPPSVDAIDMKPVWARAATQRILGSDIITLNQADLLLHLCLHLLHKGTGAPLLWYYELGRLIRQNASSLDWDLFTHHARTMGQACLIADVLETIRHHFHTTIPDAILDSLRQPFESSSAQVAHPLRDQVLRRPSLNGREEFALLFSLQGLHRQIRYVATLLFPSPRYMVRRYGYSSALGLLGSYVRRICHLSKEGCIVASIWARTIFVTRPTKHR